MNHLRVCTRLAVTFQNLRVTSHVSQRNIARHVRSTLIALSNRKRKQKNPIVNPRSKYIEWNRDAELYAFNNRLSENFDMDLLQQAFIHRSYIIKEEEEQKKVGIEDPQIDLEDNRELIDEGREIVDITIEKYLQQTLPLAPRECIHALKKYLLSTEVLAKTSSGIGTKDLILSMEFPIEDESLVNTFYALVSALKRSVDLEHAGIFVRDILIAQLAKKDLQELWYPDDPVDALNDILENEERGLAEPRIIAQTGVNTLIAVYQVGMYCDQELLGSGIGETLEEAEKIAAMNALYKMFGLLDSSRPMRCDLKINESVSDSLPLEEWSRSKVKN